MKEKQQIIHIHGAEAWEDVTVYIDYLKNKKCDPYASLKKGVGTIIIIHF